MYVEFQVTTNYFVLRGAFPIEELVTRAAPARAGHYQR